MNNYTLSCTSSDRYEHHCHLAPGRVWLMLSPLVNLTTATVCYMLGAQGCSRSYRVCRTLQPSPFQGHGKSTLSPCTSRSQVAACCKRIVFKMEMLVYRCLHGMAPPYLVKYCVPALSTLVGLEKGLDCVRLIVVRKRPLWVVQEYSVHLDQRSRLCCPLNFMFQMSVFLKPSIESFRKNLKTCLLMSSD